MSDPEPFRISCSECALEHTSACDDCIVTFICSREPGDAVVIEASELRALRALGDGGLVPQLRHTSTDPTHVHRPHPPPKSTRLRRDRLSQPDGVGVADTDELPRKVSGS